MQTIDWVAGPDGGAVVIIDQTALPHEVRHLTIDDVDELIDAIRRLAVRGAPALGAAGALGVVIALQQGRAKGWDDDQVADAIGRVRSARPTAVNLAWGVDRIAAVAAASPGDLAAVEAEARAVLDEDVAANTAIGELGADLLAELCGCRPPATSTGCASTRTATPVRWPASTWAPPSASSGRCTPAVRSAAVYADETRPLLQGARLTAWELDRMGVDYRVVVDGAGPSLIARGLVDAVVVGADRVAANGDVANKIGTYPLALAAARAGIPFVVAAPESTVDPATPDGDAITIEDRGDDEVLVWGGVSVAPAGRGPSTRRST